MAGRYPAVPSARAWSMGEDAIASLDEVGHLNEHAERITDRLEHHLQKAEHGLRVFLHEIERLRPHVGPIEVDRLESLEQHQLRGLAEDEHLAHQVKQDLHLAVRCAHAGIQAQLRALRELGHPELIPQVALGAQGAIEQLVAEHKTRSAAATVDLGNEQEAG